MQSHMTGQFEEHFKNSNVTKKKSRKLQANNRCARSQDFQLSTHFKRRKWRVIEFPQCPTINACQRSCRKVMFSVVSVCLSVCRGRPMCHCSSDLFIWRPRDLFKFLHLGTLGPVQTSSLGKGGGCSWTEKPLVL